MVPSLSGLVAVVALHWNEDDIEIDDGKKYYE